MIIIIDNYDSFTYNLYQYIGEIYEDIQVIRNDEITIEEIRKLNPEGIILSPGPGRPEQAGICIDLIKEIGNETPILGICLGHQAIGCALGGKVIRAEEIRHGKTSMITNDGTGLFSGLNRRINVMRYHSLIVDKASVPEELRITATTEDGIIMGICHREYPIYGLQFHPESILTEQGKVMIKNFVEGICGVKRCY